MITTLATKANSEKKQCDQLFRKSTNKWPKSLEASIVYDEAQHYILTYQGKANKTPRRKIFCS
jgi:hypothetical protein